MSPRAVSGRLVLGLSETDPLPTSEAVVQKWYNFSETIKTPSKMWRRRVGVEPTIRSAKGRIGGFEGRDSHRTIFASS